MVEEVASSQVLSGLGDKLRSVIAPSQPIPWKLIAEGQLTFPYSSSKWQWSQWSSADHASPLCRPDF